AQTRRSRATAEAQTRRSRATAEAQTRRSRATAEAAHPRRSRASAGPWHGSQVARAAVSHVRSAGNQAANSVVTRRPVPPPAPLWRFKQDRGRSFTRFKQNDTAKPLLDVIKAWHRVLSRDAPAWRAALDA